MNTLVCVCVCVCVCARTSFSLACTCMHLSTCTCPCIPMNAHVLVCTCMSGVGVCFLRVVCVYALTVVLMYGDMVTLTQLKDTTDELNRVIEEKKCLWTELVSAREKIVDLDER